MQERPYVDVGEGVRAEAGTGMSVEVGTRVGVEVGAGVGLDQHPSNTKSIIRSHTFAVPSYSLNSLRRRPRYCLDKIQASCWGAHLSVAVHAALPERTPREQEYVPVPA